MIQIHAIPYTAYFLWKFAAVLSFLYKHAYCTYRQPLWGIIEKFELLCKYQTKIILASQSGPHKGYVDL
jgi:hypothetical protein